MFEHVSAKLIRVTPKKAGEFLKQNTFPGQRVMRPYRVAWLSSKIQNGEFRTGEIATAENCESGKIVLMNGQNQCAAIIDSEVPVTVKHEHFRCYTPEDFSLLYRTFDQPETSRNLHDMLKVEAIAIGVAWPIKITRHVVSSAAFILKGKQGGYKASEKVELLKEHLEVGSFMCDILTRTINNESWQKASRHLIRRAVGAAMIRTWSKNRNDAKEFWVKVRDCEMLKKTMPEYALHKFLLEHCAHKGISASNSRSVKDHEFFSRSITAWNVFRKGESMRQFKYYSDRPAPKAI